LRILIIFIKVLVILKQGEKIIIVTVGVICRNEENTIVETLKSLVNQTFKNFEIIIVDGNSSDDTAKNASEYLRKTRVKHKILNEKDFGGRGRAFARNLVIKQSSKSSRYIAFTDADCVANKKWLSTIIETIEKSGGDIAGVGGNRLVYENDPWIAKSINYVLTSPIGSGNNAAFKGTKERYIESIPNYNAIYKKEILKKYSYDEKFKGGEDMELNFRLRKKGFKFLYEKNAKIIHHQENSLWLFIKQMYHYGDVMSQNVKKHKTLPRIYSMVPSIFLLGNILLTIGSIFNEFVLKAYLVFLASYVLLLFFSTVQNIIKNKNICLILTPIIMLSQHLAYGLGFIRGIIWNEEY
jgi:glycosyltransferase involved in cell wall biosynthesis